MNLPEMMFRMMMKNTWMPVLLALVLGACTQNNPADKTAVLTSQLAALDAEMGGAAVSDPSKADRFIQLSEELAVLQKPTDPDKSAEILLRAAALAKAAGKSAKAVELYQRVHAEMPKHPKAPMALFMSGFVYENDLGDLQKAKAVYEQFLQEYPSDQDFADDASNALKLLGKSPEEIVREFEKLQSGKSE
jgi:tetratricopeptide (TPR) repeat protein